MTEETKQPDDPVSEDIVAEESHEVVEPTRTVPLAALEAERKKRQELEAHNRALQDLVVKSKSPPAEDLTDDDEDFVTKAEMKRRLQTVTFAQKREVLEEAFCESKPEAVELINRHLEEIINRKPWLAQTIESAPNRYARAYEIIQDYMPKETAPAKKFARPEAEAKKIIENSQKPGNPATIAKGANGSNLDYLKSIQGKPEFREYRQKMLAGG